MSDVNDPDSTLNPDSEVPAIPALTVPLAVLSRLLRSGVDGDLSWTCGKNYRHSVLIDLRCEACSDRISRRLIEE